MTSDMYEENLANDLSGNGEVIEVRVIRDNQATPEMGRKSKKTKNPKSMQQSTPQTANRPAPKKRLHTGMVENARDSGASHISPSPSVIRVVNLTYQTVCAKAIMYLSFL